MKSLNRTLSLVLVLAMCLGLMGIASAATFTDSTTIQYTDAVGVMTGIGAINGYTDGSFKPTGTITREEAAKMITYATLGASVASKLTVATTGFTDVDAARWSAPFIAYCVNKGIINGMGDGTFAPTANVTGYQLAKMLLCAAGYGKLKEFTGASWELNVAVAASKVGIFTSSKATNYGTPATREEASLYVYNALTKATQVYYDKDAERYVDVSTGLTIAKQVYGLVTATTGSTLVSGMVTGKSLNSDKEVVVSINGTATAYVYTPALSLYGHNVKLYTDGTDKVFYVKDLSTTYTVPATVTTAAGLYKALNAVVTWANTTAVPTFANYVYDAAGQATGAAAVTDVQVAALTGATLVITDGTITAVIPALTTALRTVTNVVTTLGSESITISGIAALSNTAISDKVVEYAGIAKGDVVLATVTGTGVYTLTKVTPVTGTLTAKTTDASTAVTTYTVGGKAYTASSVSNATGLTLVAPASMVVGYEYGLYLDPAGKIIASTGKETTVGNYAYIAQFGKNATYDALGNATYALTADIYFTDGKHAVYPIDTTTAGTAFTDATYSSGTTTATTVCGLGLYDVTVGANGKATVKALTAIDTALPTSATDAAVDTGDIAITKGVSLIGVDNDGSGAHPVLYAGTGSYVFYVNGIYGTTTGANTFRVTVATGIANITTGTVITSAYAHVNAAGINVLTAAVSSTTATSATTPDVLFFTGKYVDSTSIVDSKSVTTRTYYVYKNGVGSTVAYDTSATGYTGFTAKGFYVAGTYDLAAYTDTAYVATTEKTVSSAYSGTLYFSASDYVLTNDSTVITSCVPSTQTYTALVNGSDVVKVFVAYTTASTGVRTATYIYVTSVT